MIGAHNSNVDLSFYNDKVKEVIDPGIMAEPFTYVPIVAGHMELVNGNAIVFGKITEGYDIITPIVKTELDYEPITYYGGAIGDEYLTPRVNLLAQKVQVGATTIVQAPDQYLPDVEYHTNDYVSHIFGIFRAKATTIGNSPPPPDNTSLYWEKTNWNTSYYYRRVAGVIVIQIPELIYVNSYYYITITNEEEDIGTITAFYKAQPTDTYVEVKAGLEAALIIAGIDTGDLEVGPWPNCIFLYGRVRYYREFPYPLVGDINTVYKDFTFSVYVLTLGYSYKFPDLKCGATHGFGLVYKDRSGRTCSVVKTPDMNVYIPFYTEGTEYLIESIVKLTFKIYNKPPSWAKTYEIVYFGNLTMNYFLQLRADSITLVPLSNGNRFALNIQQALDWTRGKNNRWKVADYSWMAGDRIRLIGTIDPTTGYVTQYNQLYDYEIEETANQADDVIGGEWLIFQAYSHPDDFDLAETTITNLTGNLSGTVVNSQANSESTKRIDTITLSGDSGTALIRCGLVEKVITWNAGGLTDTASDFVTGNDASYLDEGMVLTSDGEDVIFTAETEGIDFPGVSNVLVEIYRPNKGLNISVAYGTGMVFDIEENAYGYLYHAGNVDQVIDSEGQNFTPAEIENTANDCWKYARLNYEHDTGNINIFWCESIFPSDWWSDQDINRKLTSNGFPFLDDLSQRQTILDERLRHGGFLITGTRTNNIAHFTYEDFLDLQKEDGDITGLREVGYTLKVIQLHKETSIYINRIQTFNPDGTEQFTLTDTFFGTTRPMEADYGCQHPDSIMVNRRNLYYWDNNEGVFIRSAPNGQQVLDIKMRRWYKDLVKWIQNQGGARLLKVFTGANNEHDEVWITFRMGDEVKGLIFSEKYGRYTSRINQITECYVHLGNWFAHLYHQILWIMNLNEGQDWLTWVGIPTYAEIEVVSNIEPGRNKIFNAVAQFVDHCLQSLAKYVYIPKEASANNILMETNIPIWEYREGIYFGEILRDENTPGNFTSTNDRKMNGRLMRGRYCFVKLMTEEHDEKVRIDSIVVFSTLSERNV